MKYPVHLQPDPDDGGFVVTCPSLPGCVSEGDTREGALENIAEAIQAWIESARMDGERIPLPGEVADVEIDVQDAA